jgi:hypothetical protein
MFRSAAFLAVFAVTAVSPPAWAGETKGLWIDDLSVRDRLEVRTTKYVLRLDVVDPASGEALASLSNDGVHFGQADRVFVLGATKGRHPEGLMFVRMGRLDVGKGIELAVHSMDVENRRITAPIESIQVTPADPMARP